MTVQSKFRSIAAALMIAAPAVTSLAAPTAAAPAIGEAAPPFTAVDSRGKPVALADFKGKTVILEWTNHDCPYVGKHYSTNNMQSLQKAATASGLVWLTVVSSARGQQGHVDGPAADKLTETRKAAPSAVLLDPDGTLGRLYDAKTTPHMFVIKPDGKLAYNGAIDDKPTTDSADVATAKSFVKNAMDAVAVGKPVDPAVTRAYGCSVKYKS
ncbi:MAG: redoxin domain-containing protein [Hyphomicrobium aestuarii]|nr:redoxin domain-containing protein [Hyphomicrobium aestuarii]